MKWISQSGSTEKVSGFEITKNKLFYLVFSRFLDNQAYGQINRRIRVEERIEAYLCHDWSDPMRARERNDAGFWLGSWNIRMARSVSPVRPVNNDVPRHRFFYFFFLFTSRCLNTSLNILEKFLSRKTRRIKWINGNLFKLFSIIKTRLESTRIIQKTMKRWLYVESLLARNFYGQSFFLTLFIFY